MKNTLHYNFMVRALRTFFQEKKGFIEVPSQSRLSILAACGDPATITNFSLNNVPYPLPQTGQMWLKYELLSNPEWKGVYCISTSYPDEPNPIEGRHYRIFAIFEFESHDGFDELKQLEEELLLFLGFEQSVSILYEEACAKYETQIIEAQHEIVLAQEISNPISLEKFPSRTPPCWNIKNAGNGVYNKEDVLLHGMETSGSAERESDKEKIREGFFAMSQGKHAQLLISKFGRERLGKELDEYLPLPLFKRFGGGIGLIRLECAMDLAGMLKQPINYQIKNFVSQPQLNI